jgi:hypothetical protein
MKLYKKHRFRKKKQKQKKKKLLKQIVFCEVVHTKSTNPFSLLN